MVTMAYRLLDKNGICKILPPRLRRFLSGFYNDARTQKARMLPYQSVKKSMSTRLDTVLTGIAQTDGRICRNLVAPWMVTRDKNRIKIISHR